MSKQPEIAEPRRIVDGETRSANVRRWYFVCLTCNAKWFAMKQEMPCPRCFTAARSRERLTPPWLSPSVRPDSSPDSRQS